MNFIVTVDQNWGLEKQNRVLVNIPADMKFFRDTTQGKVVVMEGKTLERFPQKQPLKDRINVILTKEKEYMVNGAIVVATMDALLETLKEYNAEDIYVIGESQLFKALLPYCNLAHVTKIDYAYEVDQYFPDLEKMEDWKLTGISEEQTYFDLEYYFARYERVK